MGISRIISMMLIGLWLGHAAASPVVEQRLQQALALSSQGQWHQAFERLEELPSGAVLSAVPGQAWYLRATLAQKLNQSALAMHAWQQVWQYYPVLADYAAMAMAQLQAEADDVAGLQGTVMALATRYPFSLKGPESRLLLAQTQQRLGQLEAARSTAEQLLQSVADHPTRATTLALLAQIYEDSGAIRLAAQTWQRYGETAPGDAGAARALEHSRELWQQVPAAQRPQPDPAQLLATLEPLAVAKLWLEVEQRLDTLTGLTLPTALAAEVLLQRGILAQRRRQWAVAETALLTLLEHYPHSAQRLEAQVLMAQGYKRQGKKSQSAHYYERVLSHGLQSPWAAEALLELAGYEAGQGASDRAQQYAQQLWQHFPAFEPGQEYLWQVAWTHYEQRRYETAERLWRDFQRYFPESGLLPQALYWEARSLHKRGQRQVAMRLYRQLMTEYPTSYYTFQASAVLRAAGLSTAVEAAPPTIFPAPPGLQRLQELEPSAATSREHFHLVRVRALQQLQIFPSAADEIRALMTLLPEDPAVHYFIAGLWVENRQHLRAFVLLNRLVSELRPAAVRGLPRPFWTLLYPRPFWDDIVTQARKTGLNPYLLLSIMRQESAFNPLAVSGSGALGLLQLLPGTAKDVAKWLQLATPTPTHLHTPSLNILLGTTYFARTLQRFDGNVVLALAGYNAGPGRAARWRKELAHLAQDEFIESIPFQETRLYVKLVLRNLMLYERLYGMT